VLHARAGPGGVDIGDALRKLWAEGVHTILCECGGRLTATLMEAKVLNRLYLFIAPKMLGAPGSPAFGTGTALSAWQVRETRRLGQDALVVLEPARRS
jgi:diaminohydroxyphosphoribosylaminopyrimidine deaminase/5-amino-6-(5-phosphoribosylamino)uracil reductase